MTNHNDPAHGWEPEIRVQNQCADCCYCVRQHRMAACDYAQPQFPAAHKCPRYLPDDVDD